MLMRTLKPLWRLPPQQMPRRKNDLLIASLSLCTKFWIISRCWVKVIERIYAATFRIAFMRFSFLRPPQYFATFFLLLANVPKSTTGMFRSPLK